MTNFKSFPLSSDLMSVPDQHFAGIAGAHRILMQISAEIHRLDAGYNELGTRGAVVLFDGLDQTRRRFSVLPTAPRGRTPSPNRYRMMAEANRASPTTSPVTPTTGLPGQPGELWGLSEINLARNQIEDDGLLAAANYVKRDQWMRDLLLQDNLITLVDVVDAVVERLNASLLVKMSLSSNPLDNDAVIRFFETLNAPKLRELHMSTCGLLPTVVPAICDFIRSPRSQRMGILELNANALSRGGVTAILDAIEVGNFTISRIGLFANNSAPARLANEDQGAGYFGDEGDDGDDLAWESDETMSREDPRSMFHQIERRVPALQKRNGKLMMRVRNAAARAIAPLRMILHARAPTELETAARVLEDTTVSDSPTAPHFPLLDLPVEVQLLVARHCSGDAYAMSDAQWARVLKHASDRATLARLAQRTSQAQARVANLGAVHDVKKYKAREVRDEWLAELKCEWWELENQRYWDQLRRKRELR